MAITYAELNRNGYLTGAAGRSYEPNGFALSRSLVEVTPPVREIIDRRRFPRGMSLVCEVDASKVIRGLVQLGAKERKEADLTRLSFPYDVDIEILASGERALVTEPSVSPRYLLLDDAAVRETIDNDGHFGVEFIFAYDPILGRQTGYHSIILTRESIIEQRVTSETRGYEELRRLAHIARWKSVRRRADLREKESR